MRRHPYRAACPRDSRRDPLGLFVRNRRRPDVFAGVDRLETQPSARRAPGISPGGVTTSVSAAAESTEDEYFQACRAAREWMEQQPGDLQAQIEPYLATLQSSDAPGPSTFEHPMVAACPGPPGRGHRRRPGRRRSGLQVGLPFLITSRRRGILDRRRAARRSMPWRARRPSPEAEELSRPARCRPRRGSRPARRVEDARGCRGDA